MKLLSMYCFQLYLTKYIFVCFILILQDVTNVLELSLFNHHTHRGYKTMLPCCAEG